MLQMGPRLRLFALTAHIVLSVGALGAVACFLVLALLGFMSKDAPMLQGLYHAMDRLAWLVILPLVLAALLGGILQSLGTPWGLIRHYWVAIKLLITLVMVAVLLLQMELISLVANAAARTAFAATELMTARLSLVLHAGGGFLLLLVTTALAVYKPRGLTRFGAKRDER